MIFLRNRSRRVIIVLGLIASFVLGISYERFRGDGGNFSGDLTPVPGGNEELRNVDLTPFWTVWNLIDEKHVSPEKATAQERVWGATEGLARSLGDPYTVFFPPRAAEFFASEVRGNFSGIGVEIGVRDQMLTVIAPLKGTPAERSGIRAGDKIIAIEATSTAELSLDEAISFIRGESGSKVKLTIAREGANEPIEVSVTRAVIDIPTIETERREGGVFVIKLYNFNAQSTVLFRRALREFLEAGNDKLVLDLRNNPGGYLEAAIDIASWFLPAGTPVVRERFGSGKEEEVYRSKGYAVVDDSKRFIVLINRGSASASEILASALRDHGAARLLGEKSFGKGSVQEFLSVTPDTAVKITVAEWLTPKGNQISGQGLEPDIAVPLTDKDIDSGKDPQMDEAIRMLREGR